MCGRRCSPGVSCLSRRTSKPGERRPVVVCQHGRNGLPRDTIDGRQYGLQQFRRAAGRARLRHLRPPQSLSRRGPLPLARPQGQQRSKPRCSPSSSPSTTRSSAGWSNNAFVDGSRIAFYGLSYGGETAVRVPPLLEKYCPLDLFRRLQPVDPQSGRTDEPFSFMRTIEWEMPYWNLGTRSTTRKWPT